jgi:hypothetical protein
MFIVYLKQFPCYMHSGLVSIYCMIYYSIELYVTLPRNSLNLFHGKKCFKQKLYVLM